MDERKVARLDPKQRRSRGELARKPIGIRSYVFSGKADSDHSPDRRIIALVQKCLDARGVAWEAWEREINERVAALYGL